MLAVVKAVSLAEKNAEKTIRMITPTMASASAHSKDGIADEIKKNIPDGSIYFYSLNE